MNTSIKEETPLKEQNGKGLLQIFTGDGKGKTTAALGTILRASGHGMRVYIIFFLKGYPSGERKVLSELPNVDMASFGSRNFVKSAQPKAEDIEQAKLALATAREAMLSSNYDLVVLDEIAAVLNLNLLELDEVTRLIGDKPPQVELILTGRQVDPRLVEMADLVTEMVKIKHPFDKGIKARRGIEY
ncbi:cob(I)yrinic acid a,c-diamide adenosyltransferase [Chloroflexota bacterium]